MFGVVVRESFQCTSYCSENFVVELYQGDNQ